MPIHCDHCYEDLPPRRTWVADLIPLSLLVVGAGGILIAWAAGHAPPEPVLRSRLLLVGPGLVLIGVLGTVFSWHHGIRLPRRHWRLVKAEVDRRCDVIRYSGMLLVESIRNDRYSLAIPCGESPGPLVQGGDELTTTYSRLRDRLFEMCVKSGSPEGSFKLTLTDDEHGLERENDRHFRACVRLEHASSDDERLVVTLTELDAV
ncbi:MAG: hypothetical protein AAF533_14625 [Acidobacteriota bacterium]